ncbi:hypothetical protein I9G50_004981, partial [Salmonella enterica]|nr:hypothetical protein [Salmonella enterica]
MAIDLNADVGEGCASDGKLLTLVSSANISCGFYAGDAHTMLTCVLEALKNGVAIGAHPSFSDRDNFGRTAMVLSPEMVYAQTLYQIGALIHDEEQALAQTLDMVQAGRVKSVTGVWTTVTAQTVCIHGDGEYALAFARRLRAAFNA